MLKLKSKINIEGENMKKMGNKKMLSGVMMNFLISLCFILLISSLVLAGQVPSAMYSNSRCGNYNFVLNRSIANVGNHAAPAFGDLNSNGFLDMIVGNSAGYLQHFRNDNGTWVNINTDLVGKQGEHARPELVDWDKDGDLDLIFVRGNSQISLYDNVGDKKNPDFQLVRDFFGTPWAHSGISVADMNYNGHYDMVVTDGATRYTRFYENVVGTFGFNFRRLNREFLGYTNNYANCNFLDYDYDGDLDVICIQDDGKVFVHVNVGNSTHQVWHDRSFKETHIYDFGAYKNLFFVDYTGNGAYDMFTGNVDGTVSFYKGTYKETGKMFDFELETTNFFNADVGSYASPAFYDLTNNGYLDAYVADTDNQRVLYFRNDEGSFGYIGQVISGTGTRPLIKFKDLNDDGLVDLIISNVNGHINYYRNIGTLGNPVWDTPVMLYNVGFRTGVDFADINGNGLLDMVASAIGEQWSRVYYNVGNESNPIYSNKFESGYASKINVGCFNPYFYDMNKNGVLDMITGECNGEIKYYRNNGNNTHPDYEFIRTWLDVGDWSAPAVADINNNGNIDLIWGRSNDGLIRHWESVSDKFSINFTLESEEIHTSRGINSNPFFIDMNGNGLQDMVVGYSDGWVHHFENVGNSTNPEYQHVRRWFDVGSWAAPTMGDLNNDGNLDILWGRSNDGRIRYYRNTASYHSIDWNRLDDNMVDYKTTHTIPYFGDLNGNGVQDMVLGYSNGNVDLYFNQGNETYYDFVFDRTLFNVGSHAAPALGDFNGNGKLDMIVGRSNNDRLYYYENVGTSSDPDWSLVSTDFLGYGSSSYIRPFVVDFDGDGDLDIVTGHYDGRIRYHRNDGTSLSPSWGHSEVWGHFSSYYSSVAVVDIFDEGKYSLVVGFENGDIQVYYNKNTQPSVSWERILGYKFGDDGSRWMDNVGGHSVVRPVDLTGKGRLDFVAGNTAGDVRFYRNDGVFTDLHNRSLYPTFTDHTDYYAGWNHGQYLIPRLVDFDGDGDLDIVLGVYHWRDGGVYYIRNDGSLENANWINQGWWLKSGYGHFSPSVGDITGNGLNDVLLSWQGGENRLYVNEGTPETPVLRRVHSFLGGNYGDNWMHRIGSHATLSLVDLNGDGTHDVLGGRSDGKVVHYKNNGVFDSDDALATYPSFIHRSDNFLNWNNGNHLIPRFVDFDGDGDLDIVLGLNHWQNGGVYYFRNEGDSEIPFWVHRGRWFANQYGHSSPALGDLNGDGKYEIIVGTSDGRSSLYVNDGTVENPIWTRVLAGDQSSSYLPNIGGHVKNFIYDLTGNGEMDIISSSYQGHVIINRNEGLYNTNRQRALNAMFIHRSNNIGADNGGSWVNPKLVDLDGDGDYDLVTGRENGCIYFWRNIGNNYQYRWASAQTLVCGGSRAEPAFADVTGNGKLDLFMGRTDGHVYFYENKGNYEDSCVTITNSSNHAISGVSVVFYDDNDDIVCDTSTNSFGTSSCDLNLANEGKIRIQNAPREGFAQLGLTTYNSLGKTIKILESKSSNYEISLKRFQVSSAGPKGSTNWGSHIRLYDEDAVSFLGHTNKDGYLDGILPEKYLVNKMEPYSQNRIMYDLHMYPSEYYGSLLKLEDIYVPNNLLLGSTTYSNKLFKFPTARTQATNAIYKHYLIYPVVRSQKDFDFIDRINSNFTLIGDLKVTLGSEENLKKCFKTLSGTGYLLNETDVGCEFLGNEITSFKDGDWLVLQYEVESPGLDLFLLNGWETRTFAFPSADLTYRS